MHGKTPFEGLLVFNVIIICNPSYMVFHWLKTSLALHSQAYSKPFFFFETTSTTLNHLNINFYWFEAIILMPTFKPLTNPFSTFFLFSATIIKYSYIYIQRERVQSSEKPGKTVRPAQGYIHIFGTSKILDRDKRSMSMLNVKVQLIKCMGGLVDYCTLEMSCKLCIGTPNFPLVINLLKTTESNTMWRFTTWSFTTQLGSIWIRQRQA